MARSVPRAELERPGASHDQVFVDTGYAYHVMWPSVTTATGLSRAAALLDLPPERFAAIGDSANDAAPFDLVGRSYAVGNADETAREYADVLTGASFSDGAIEALDDLRRDPR